MHKLLLMISSQSMAGQVCVLDNLTNAVSYEIMSLRLLPTFASVLWEKIRTRASLSETLANYISKESRVNVLYDKNII